MLTEKRHEQILKLLEERGSITVAEAKEILGTSESTIRRDITVLDREGKLVKVFGGAVSSARNEVSAYEYTVAQKQDLNSEEKKRIAKYAASLIEPEDFVYLDAGTTTAYMLDYIGQKNITFVTNAVAHAQRLVSMKKKVLLIGGELKASTEAVVGSQAILTLQEYHFTKGFFGSNGVARKSGCTTPDASEAMVKRTAMEQCASSYVLCDESKFGHVSSVTFAPFYGTTFLTDKVHAGYEDCENVIVAGMDDLAIGQVGNSKL